MATVTIRDLIYDQLAASTGVAGLVSTRIYRELLPQNATFPALTYSRLSGERMFNLSGPAGMARPTFTVSAWADDAGAAEDLAEAVRVALNGWSDTTAGVYDTRIIGELDVYDDGLEKHQIICDFAFMHTE